MTKDRHHRFDLDLPRAVLCVAAAASLALSACNQQTGEAAPAITMIIEPTATATLPPAASETPSPIPPSATPLPTATPVPPKPVTIALIGEPDSLHPLYATSQSAQAILGALFVGCIGQDEHGSPVALGCDAVPTLENGGARWAGEGDARHLESTFHIRQGWRWTDGQPVTAQDAIFSWRTIMSPGAQLRDPLTEKVYAMTAPDERTIVVSFMSAAQAREAAAGRLQGDVAFDYFAQRGDYAAYAKQSTPLADANYWAVVRWLPAHLLQNVAPQAQLTDAFASKPVGDGAFELSAWNKGSDLTLTRSAQPFPLQPQGNIPAIIFKFVPDEAAAAGLVQNGDAQLSQPLAVGAISATAAMTQVVEPVVEQIVLNTTRAPFDDMKVRQALRLAVNADAIMRDPVTGPVTTAQIIDPTGIFYSMNNAGLLAGGDAAKAKALLGEAGWACEALPCTRQVKQKSGAVVTETLSFTLTTNERIPRNAISQIVQQQLQAAGFSVDIHIVAGLGKQSRLFASFDRGGILLTRNFDAALYQAPSLTRFNGVFDCASIPGETAPQPTQGNVFGYCDPALDGLILAAESGEAAVSTAGRVEAITKVFDAINGAALFAPLYSPLLAFPAQGVSGVKYGGFGVMTWNAWEWN
ncbi:MAG: ABC transporter substrate-binding protein [Chloroflexi bacterium]|nr:ABC transporter substrate-binding protein [Chloroflexota bacterium]MCL5275686.1 ABC transporter substrate-binding protein [Chloroflexota bacterium]